MAARKARIGFIGTGFMGQLAHLGNYATDPDCQVLALAEVRPKLAAAVATQYGVPKVYADHREAHGHPARRWSGTGPPRPAEGRVVCGGFYEAL